MNSSNPISKIYKYILSAINTINNELNQGKLTKKKYKNHLILIKMSK